jgi:DNA-binding NtrC family response regulator
MRTLIADDDQDFLELIAKVIEQRSDEVVCACSGNELLYKLAEGTPFDVVIADRSMPWVTGLRLLQSGRKTELLCPIVIMTALRDYKTAAQAAALSERVTLLHKPFSIGALRATLRTCLGQDLLTARHCG